MIHPMDGLDSEAIARTNLDSRAVTTTATIGSLPLTSFIYILTATFVFLICLLPLVKFFLAVRIGPAYYYERYLGTGSTSVSRDEQEKPNFRQSQGGGPGHLESLARIAIDKSPMQATLYTPPPVHNLPLPIGDLAIIPADKTVEVLSLDHLYDTQELWAEKKRLDSSIHNLKRVCGVPGRDVASNMLAQKRLHEASQKREQLITAIDAIFSKLREQRSSWTYEEWSLIEQIMQAYGRRA